MIEMATRQPRLERIEPDRPPYLDSMKCGRCGNRLASVYLTPGSWVIQRCHHSIRKPDGTRETCGWENTVRPTR